MKQAILLILIIVVTVAFTMTKPEHFISACSLEDHARALVCAYHSFLTDPRLDLSKQPIHTLYELEWHKKTEKFGLPYVYEPLFFDMHYYVLFEARRNRRVTYWDIYIWILPYVEELYNKNNPLLNNSICTSSFVIKYSSQIMSQNIPADIPLTPLVPAPISKYDDDNLLPAYAIYNRNTERYKPEYPEWLSNDRAGNNTPQTYP